MKICNKAGMAISVTKDEFRHYCIVLNCPLKKSVCYEQMERDRIVTCEGFYNHLVKDVLGRKP